MHEGDEAVKYDPMMPIWNQVANTIKQQIVNGRIQPGEKLPSGRDLAVEYSINPNTAARIYQELERDGICATRRGMGTYITEDSGRIQQLREEMAEKAIRRFLAEMRGLGLGRSEVMELIEKETQEEMSEKTQKEEDTHAQE